MSKVVEQNNVRGVQENGFFVDLLGAISVVHAIFKKEGVAGENGSVGIQSHCLCHHVACQIQIPILSLEETTIIA
jgi:hypothetical protein